VPGVGGLGTGGLQVRVLLGGQQAGVAADGRFLSHQLTMVPVPALSSAAERPRLLTRDLRIPVQLGEPDQSPGQFLAPSIEIPPGFRWVAIQPISGSPVPSASAASLQVYAFA